MKRFWKVLLLGGLIMAFSVPAIAAVDVKFSGSYYAQGWYISNHELNEDKDARAFVNQRLRVGTVFQVAEGLALTTRFDALEKKWGDQTWKGGFEDVRDRPTYRDGAKEQENIEFERAYVSFATGIGLFDVGYQQGSSLFGTDFLDSDESIGRVKYTLPVGPHALVLSYEKLSEDMAGNSARDADDTAYAVGGICKLPGGEAGLIYKYLDLKSNRPEPVELGELGELLGELGEVTEQQLQQILGGGLGYKSRLHVVNPYVKMAAGPLNVEAEAYYIGGKAAEWESDQQSFHPEGDIDAESYGGYVKAQMERAPGYAGVILAYMRGDDDPNDDKMEGGFMPELHWGENFNPCLILWNYDYNHDWVGNLRGSVTNTDPITGYMDNVRFGQIYAGFKPIPKLDLKASVAYAKADETPADVDDEYGTEADVTASYKIYNNLEYMIGAAYLWAGDYFKGTYPGYKIDDNYLLMHKLTLTF